MRRGRLGAAATCLGLLMACTPAPPPEPSPSPSPSPTTTPTGETDLAPFLAQQVAWRDCPREDEYLDAIPEQAECTEVEVPVNYFDNGSSLGTMDIALIRIPADGAAAGSVLVNPGGPGASGFDTVASSAKSLQRNFPGYDIVGFDPRGVSRSAGYDCRQNDRTRLDLIEQDFTPEDSPEFEETLSRASDYEQACRDSYEAWGFLGTSSVARDVNVVSKALGDEQINFYGMSYGSEIGYELLRTYPDDIGRMVLESLVDPSVEEVAADQMAAFNTKLEELLRKCAEPKYAFCGKGRTAQQVRDAFIAAGGDIENPNYQTLTDNGQPSESLAFYGMILPLYWEWTDEYTQWYLEAVSALINDEDAKPFEFWGYLYEGYDANQRQFTASDDIFDLVTCLDVSTPLDDTNIEEERAKSVDEIARMESEAPLLHAVGFDDAYLDDDRAFEPCSYAQEAFDDPAVPDPLLNAPAVSNPSATPVLLLGISGDTATPYAWAQAVAGQLGMPLVTQDTTGHAVYVESDNSCTQGIVAEYLASGTLPPGPTTC